MNILMVCHAGAGLGLGHLTRSLVMARALIHKLDTQVQFLIQGDRVQRTDLSAFTHQFITVEQSLLAVLQLMHDAIKPTIIILDIHPQKIPQGLAALLNAFRNQKTKVVGVDSLAGLHDALDLLFIPSFRLPACVNDSASTPVLFGWDCFLLNVQYLPKAWQSSEQVLALTGGSDATCLGQTWPKQIDSYLPKQTHLHWVVGPYAQAPTWPTDARLTFSIHNAPDSLDQLMLTASYAITVFGVSFFELLHYGVPTVVFSPYGNKDAAELAEIALAGVALVAKDEGDALIKLSVLMSDDGLARTLAQRAQQKLFSSGAEKLVHAVTRLLE